MLQNIIKSSIAKITTATNTRDLQQLKIELLGKKSAISNVLASLATMQPEERKALGQQINNIKNQIIQALEEKSVLLDRESMMISFEKEKLDLTIPALKQKYGSIHPISQALEELMNVFVQFGFVAHFGPNIESDWYNFTALNIDEHHPARSMHDTFYLSDGRLLRTHTSTIQIRTMELMTPPLRIIAPGRVYRSDSDATHTPMFHQIEGLVIDKDINMGHLKYVLIKFIKDFFESSDIKIRFRPSFFPFTEPSAEVDICSESGKWLEILGCGMVHPQVLKNVNIDPQQYQGFAFGMGVERLAMLKYNIKDLRQFFTGDLRLLSHYNFSAFDIPKLMSGLTK